MEIKIEERQEIINYLRNSNNKEIPKIAEKISKKFNIESDYFEAILNLSQDGSYVILLNALGVSIKDNSELCMYLYEKLSKDEIIAFSVEKIKYIERMKK